MRPCEDGQVTARAYSDLLRNRGFASLMASSLVARLPLGMTSLAIVLLVSKNGAYSRAGLVIALYVTGTGIAGPILGRMVDRVGRTKILPPFAAAEAALLCVLAELSPDNTAALLTAAALAPDGVTTASTSRSTGLRSDLTASSWIPGPGLASPRRGPQS